MDRTLLNKHAIFGTKNFQALPSNHILGAVSFFKATPFWSGSVPYEVPTPNYEDPLAGPYTGHRSCVTHRPLPSIGPHHASPERCLCELRRYRPQTSDG